jgi:hypothetical protein
MYAVVGCGDCEALWVIEGSPAHSECPRCGTTREHALRRKFVETEDPDHAREVRASMLANRQGHGDEFAALDSFTAMEEHLDEAGPDDETYLAGSGLDPDEVAAAADRAGGPGNSPAREDVVREAVRELDEPDVEDVASYAADRGVPRQYVETALEGLVRTGEATENRGTYRLV